MSAITGIFYRDGRKVNPELIKKVNNRLSHRGPDGSSIFCKENVALGHQMLYTTPESLKEKLPFHEKREGLSITADARIDNRKELSEKLNIENKVDVSDSYFILKSYQKWGEKCPEYLLGDFAFAIWDENDEKLFCARDHMGVKPLYYYLDDDVFVFATEIKALLCVPEVPHELNEDRIAMFLMLINDNKSTFYENIFIFNPAHSFTIGNKSNKKRKYWELDKEYEIIMDCEEDYVRKFSALFKDAVNCRLRSAFPVGFQLSGGLDSSSVLCMAKKILDEKNKLKPDIDSFSFTFKDIPCDESFHIKRVVNIGKINPTYVLSDNINPLEEIGKILWYEEKPVFTPNLALLWNLFNAMQEKNIRVVLDGEFGDQVISYGDFYFRDLAVSFRWKTLLKELRDYSNNNKISFYKLFKSKIIYPLIPEQIKKYLRHEDTSQIEILNKLFAERTNAQKYLKELYLDPNLKNNTAKSAHYYSLTKGIFSPLELVDRINPHFSIEHRHPFLDKRLVEFCYAIPSEIKFKNGWKRYIQRIGMNNVLPPETQWRIDKTNISPYFERNLLLFEKNTLDEIMNSEIGRYVDINKIKDIYKNYIDGNADSGSIYWLWLVSILSLWLKCF